MGDESPAIRFKALVRASPAGFPLLSGLGGQFLPKFQVAGRRGTSEALMGFSSRSVILSVAEGSFCHPGFVPYQILELFKTVLNR